MNTRTYLSENMLRVGMLECCTILDDDGVDTVDFNHRVDVPVFEVRCVVHYRCVGPISDSNIADKLRRISVYWQFAGASIFLAAIQVKIFERARYDEGFDVFRVDHQRVACGGIGMRLI